MQYADGLATTMRSMAGMTRTEAKRQALSWLAAQLRWEDTLEALRDEPADMPQAA